MDVHGDKNINMLLSELVAPSQLVRYKEGRLPIICYALSHEFIRTINVANSHYVKNVHVNTDHFIGCGIELKTEEALNFDCCNLYIAATDDKVAPTQLFSNCISFSINAAKSMPN